jgi:hypothetical protein
MENQLYESSNSIVLFFSFKKTLNKLNKLAQSILGDDYVDPLNSQLNTIEDKLAANNQITTNIEDQSISK